MLGRLFLLFTVVTLLELALLLPIARGVGLLPTLALVFLTGFAGAWLAKREGSRVWREAQETLAAGGLPADAILDGIAILVAGAFMMTPGVLTDIAGFLLLIPACRRPLKAWVRGLWTRRFLQGSSAVHFHHIGVGGGGWHGGQSPFGHHDPASGLDPFSAPSEPTLRVRGRPVNEPGDP